jgi:hypothetical protein
LLHCHRNRAILAECGANIRFPHPWNYAEPA